MKRFATWAPATALLLVAMLYIGLSLVALYVPDSLPGTSILHSSLLGPPALLVWGGKLTALYCACTAALILLAVCGAFRSALRLPAALVAFVVWMGSGFLSALMSV